MRSKYRLGIDAGGTFTDFVLADQTDNARLFKVVSTPSDPTKAIRDGLQLIADDVGEDVASIISECDLCINGTTVGLNALIQHKGGKTGLICTEGHQDFDRNQIGPQGRRISLRPRIPSGDDAGATLPSQGGPRAGDFRWFHQDADERG